MMTKKKGEILFLDLINAMNWLLCYLVEKSVRKLEQLPTNLSSFDSKNTAQVYHLRTLSIVYIQVKNYIFLKLKFSFFFQCTAINRFAQFLQLNNDIDEKCKLILEKLLIIYILKLFEEYFGILFEGNYVQNGNINQWIQKHLLDLCHELRHEIVALTDVFAPPDHILNSVLGNYDGKVYEAINKMIHSNKQTFLTPFWIKKDFIERSKL
jgi:acyl-CoA oxidase